MNSHILFVSATLFFAISYTKSVAQNDKLIGSWRIDMNGTLAIMDGNAKRRYDTLSTEVHTRAINAMKDREFVFKTSGEITVTWRGHNGQRTSTGQWSIDPSLHILRITIDSHTVSYDFEMTSQTEMIWRGQVKRGFFSNLYLRKI